MSIIYSKLNLPVIAEETIKARMGYMSNINITRSMLSKWETGKAALIYDHLKCLASYYNVTTDLLLGFNQHNDLTMVNSDNNLDTNKRIRCSKKASNIKAIAQLLEDDRITNKDLLFIKDFIHLFISRKDGNPHK